MAKISKPVLYTGLLALGVAAYTMMSSDSVKSKSSIAPTKRASKNKKADIYLPEDYVAHFARYEGNSKNAFSPLVARPTIGGITGPDVVPADIAGGDPNWVFTGSSVIDGTSSALFENRATLEAEFVRQGERWKNCTVSGIQEGMVVLSSRSGKKVSLRLAEAGNQYAAVGPTSSPNTGLQPMNPALSGPIGRQVAIRPETGREPTNRSDNGRSAARGTNVQEQTNEN